MLLTPAGDVGTTPTLVRPGAALERHLPHVLPVILRIQPGGPGPTQVIFDGLEFRGPNIPLRKRRKIFFTQSQPTEGPQARAGPGRDVRGVPRTWQVGTTSVGMERPCSSSRPMRSRKATCGCPQS